MNFEIPREGLNLFDRVRLALVDWALGGLSPEGAIRWKWHLLREKAG